MDSAPQTDTPWEGLAPEPMDLLALWPGEMPDAAGVVAGLRAVLGDGVEVIAEIPASAPDVVWSIALRWPGRDEGVVLWTEPARAAGLEELDDEARGCRWLVGVETVLDRADPLTSFADLVAALAAAFPAVPAILDVNTTTWHRREDLDRVFVDRDVEPPADVLWVVHAVGRSSEVVERGASGDTIWLHTHGLGRCGAPELELLELPAASAEMGGELISAAAALLLEHAPPPAGAPFGIGAGLNVTLLPWWNAIEFMADDEPGGLAHRGDGSDEAHTGVRAVICAAEPRGTMRQIWSWPKDVIDRLAGGDAALYLTSRATERQARLAQAGWGELVALAATPGEGAGECEPALLAVKAGLVADGDDTSRVHLWFEVDRVDADRARGRLAHEPHGIARLSKGDEEWIDAGAVTDWRVMTPSRGYGPEDLVALRAAGLTLDLAKASTAGTAGLAGAS